VKSSLVEVFEPFQRSEERGKGDLGCRCAGLFLSLASLDISRDPLLEGVISTVQKSLFQNVEHSSQYHVPKIPPFSGGEEVCAIA
jgi:hypothetical protein